jgi:hypothetical protein
MTEAPLFSPRLLGIWIALGIITFGLSLWFMFHQESDATIGPSTYSSSAIGHAGIAATLEALKIPVIRSKSESLHRVSNKGLLVLAEPEIEIPSDGKVEALLRAKIILLVLPKWAGQADRDHPGWIAGAGLVPPAPAEWALNHVVRQGDVLPPAPVETWTRNDLGPAPHFAGNVQLVKSDELKPIVATEAGILLGEFTEAGRKIWVLSDPDVIANHGLARGNADFAVALFQRLRAGGPVVFDETIHGFEPVPKNPFDLVLHKRFMAATMEALAALLLLLWATLGRFGTAETAPPPLEPGKRSLIRNVAELMDYAGYQHVLVRRYVEATIRNAALQLHAPRGLDAAANLDWLQRLAIARGGTIDAPALSRQAAIMAASRRRNLSALFGIAREIRIWKRELTDGPSGGAQDRGGNSRRGAEGGGRPG